MRGYSIFIYTIFLFYILCYVSADSRNLTFYTLNASTKDTVFHFGGQISAGTDGFTTIDSITIQLSKGFEYPSTVTFTMVDSETGQNVLQVYGDLGRQRIELNLPLAQWIKEPTPDIQVYNYRLSFGFGTQRVPTPSPGTDDPVTTVKLVYASRLWTLTKTASIHTYSPLARLVETNISCKDNVDMTKCQQLPLDVYIEALQADVDSLSIGMIGISHIHLDNIDKYNMQCLINGNYANAKIIEWQYSTHQILRIEYKFYSGYNYTIYCNGLYINTPSTIIDPDTTWTMLYVTGADFTSSDSTYRLLTTTRLKRIYDPYYPILTSKSSMISPLYSEHYFVNFIINQSNLDTIPYDAVLEFYVDNIPSIEHIDVYLNYNQDQITPPTPHNNDNDHTHLIPILIAGNVKPIDGGVKLPKVQFSPFVKRGQSMMITLNLRTGSTIHQQTIPSSFVTMGMKLIYTHNNIKEPLTRNIAHNLMIYQSDTYDPYQYFPKDKDMLPCRIGLGGKLQEDISYATVTLSVSTPALSFYSPQGAVIQCSWGTTHLSPAHVQYDEYGLQLPIVWRNVSIPGNSTVFSCTQSFWWGNNQITKATITLTGKTKTGKIIKHVTEATIMPSK